MMKITFVGNFRNASGTSEVIRNYYEVGKKINIAVSIAGLGAVDKAVSSMIPVQANIQTTDILVLVFETTMNICGDQFKYVADVSKKVRTLILDTDGKYGPFVSLENDSSHSSNSSAVKWRELMSSLSDRIYQPKAVNHSIGDGETFLFYGFPSQTYEFDDTAPYPYDILYMGNNWHRWKQISTFVAKLHNIRYLVPKIAIFGRGWNSEPIFGPHDERFSDQDFLNRHDVSVFPSAPFGTILECMSQGKFNPVLVRPILSHMMYLTPRMFETFAANTVPILSSELNYLTKVFGPEVLELVIEDNEPAHLITKVLENRRFYIEVLHSIRSNLVAKQSYSHRLFELIELATS